MRIAIYKQRPQHPVQEHTHTHDKVFPNRIFIAIIIPRKFFFLTEIFQFTANSMDNYVSTNNVCGTHHAICHLADIDDC